MRPHDLLPLQEVFEYQSLETMKYIAIIIAATIAVITIASAMSVKCNTCNGTGWKGQFRCAVCGGDGDIGR